jgi:arylsulfatase A
LVAAEAQSAGPIRKPSARSSLGPWLCPGFAVVWLVLATSSASAGADTPGVPSAPAPNVIVILADDLGWAQSGLAGGDYYEAPALQQLAREGMLFTAAYAAAPVCSPTRAALMTGLSPARLRLTDFIPSQVPPGRALVPPIPADHLPLATRTLAERARAAGYRTALFGKWHLARGYFRPESEQFPPSQHGFDESVVTNKPGHGDDPERDAHHVDRLTDLAVDFIDRHRERAFLLLISHNTPHTPLMERRQAVDRFRAKPGAGQPGNNPTLGAMIATLDRSLGRLIARLAETGLEKRTVVVFTSDNGGLRRVADQSPLRGGKSQLYEGGIRVPLVIRWPGIVAPGLTTPALVGTADLGATLLELVGARPAEPLDGVPFASVLRGEASAPRGPLFWHYPHYHAEGGEPASAVRRGDWKLIEFHEHSLTGSGTKPQLFNLSSDPGETHDLADAHPALATELLSELKTWRQNVGAAMPTLPAAR